MHIINTLLPIFLIIGIGAALRRGEFLRTDFVNGLTRLTYWIAVRCLLFYKVALAEYDFEITSKIFLVVISGMTGCIIVSCITAFVIRIPVRSIGTFVQGSYRSNLAFIGLPVVVYSFSNAGGVDAEKMQMTAVLVIALVVPVYNTLAIIMLLASRHRLDRHVPMKIIRQAIINPLFLSCLLGVVYSIFFVQIPKPIDRTLSAIAAMALPMALLTIGARLSEEKIAGQFKNAICASAIKLTVGPVIGLIMLKLLDLGTEQARIAMIFLACPTAIVSYVLVEQLGGDGKLSAKIVVWTSIFSIVPLTIIVGCF